MVEQTLKQYFGFDSLRHGQHEVIHNIIDGHSAAAIFPTGSGKSLCYQLPALMLPHLTLVISPLLALMKDQLAFLHEKGIAAASIDSSQDRIQTQQVMQSVRNGDIKILMISVERLKNERFRQFISQVPISLLVVDEAHCISEWGHNFRPDYLKLPQYKQALNIKQVLLLTATATPNVINDMQKKFGIEKQHITVTGFYRPNLDLTITPHDEEDKIDGLIHLLKDNPELPTIVYVTLQHTAEQVAQLLQGFSIPAMPYHAGLKTEQKEQIQHDFMSGKINCIVATIAFGMGVDKANIRRVIHFDLPKSIENYSQEIGRAGRDGNPSTCTLLANATGMNVLENFVYGDTPDKSSIQYVVEQIYAQNERWEIMLNRLSRDSNIRQLPLKTLLVYLELEGIIEPLFSYFAEYRFKCIQTEQQIMQHFQGERLSFVQAIFRCSHKAKTWSTLDFDMLWSEHHADRQRVIAAIDYFHEQGWIELESKQVTDVYNINPNLAPKDELTEHLYQLFNQKELSEMKRLTSMLNFFESTSCLSHQLADYFADTAAPTSCNHCSVCRGKPAQLPKNSGFDINMDELNQWVRSFIAASPEPLSDQAITRFLCGITTPLSTKLKAGKITGFGQLEVFPFEQVKSMVKTVRS
ncbi:recombinase RecQ [Vibrio sp. 10N.286.49.B3]|uniref:RecQ family ATP-dependent DNA helicase n=1 Tax=Vibrio sp. 10N.286.49.B3 TaxID=1880855 RepID=UPI000C84D65E|nr:RecQ family ATP-dependent DNA helicase [Vibrio sp. 10N.286.49.B3]PMH41138.1 recombinase RecQ [Vibrio sp. 10N.286.49.B3]